MAIRLLDKKNISEQKALERKKEVEEGLKLAKRVDNLREVASKEEANLAKFRTESLKLIQTEIDSKIKESKNLDSDLISKRDERLKLEAPIDLTQEWIDVRTLKQELEDREILLINRETLVQNLEKREVAIVEREKQAITFLDEARQSYMKTEELRSDMESRKKDSDTKINEKLHSLSTYETDLVSREEVIKDQLKQIAGDKKELLDKGTSLISLESKIDVDTRLIKEREQSIKDSEVLTKRFNDEAALNYQASDSLKLETQRLHDESQKAIHTRYVELAEKEREFGYKERDLILQKEGLERDRKALEQEKMHVASQQQTLRQTWKNIKNLQK